MVYKKTYRKKKIYRRKRYYRRRYKGKKSNKMYSVTIRQPGAIASDKYRVKLIYVDTTSSKIGTLSTSSGFIRYWANNLYDPNPNILTTTVPGYKQLGQFYQRNRVLATSIRVNVCNQENFPVIILVWPSYGDLNLFITSTFLQEMIANPYVKYKMLAAKGGMDRAMIKLYVNWKKFVGTTNVSTDADYSAELSTPPKNLLYLNIGAYTLDNTSFTTAGVQFEAKLTFYTEFYER